MQDVDLSSLLAPVVGIVDDYRFSALDDITIDWRYIAVHNTKLHPAQQLRPDFEPAKDI